MDHHILESLLRRKIQDQQFIDLYWKLVRAGYVERGRGYSTEVGVPQGSLVSPILSNIYLHEFDVYMRELSEELSSKKKEISKVNPKIVNYTSRMKKC